MKVSRKWLQRYFGKELPDTENLADALTFHAFEIEERAGDTLDVKVLPNRAADCLSHRGIAKELSAILNVPMKEDPLRMPSEAFPDTKELTVRIEDPKKCSRYMGALVKGVKVGPSPSWLREVLEAVGGRSINNVVDATNYVMLDIGQPLHAFDAAKLAVKDGAYGIAVRDAKKGERMTTLSGEECALTPDMLVIADAHADVAVGIAGVKGGKGAEVADTTTDLVIEAANFDGAATRRTAQTLRLFTDASQRFQNCPSPELAAYGMHSVLALIQDIAGGEVVGVTDAYPRKPEPKSVSVTLARVNGLLGSRYTSEEVENALTRLSFSVQAKDETYTVTPPFERTDISIPEDLIEEVGRLMSYDHVPVTELPPAAKEPDQARYNGIERIKDQLMEQGFIEVSTQSFAKKGAVELANPMDKTRPALRTSLEANLAEALAKAKLNAPLVLPPNAKPKLFEVGTVFSKNGEHIELRMTEPAPGEGWEKFGTVDNLSNGRLEEFGKDYEPKQYRLGAYHPFSAYPFIARDVAFWTPEGTEAGEPERIIRETAGELLLRLDQFDRFEKDGRVSYAYRLVFQSTERTLTDSEINGVMEVVSAALSKAGFEVR